MPSLFSRKRRESTPALKTPPVPPPKDFDADSRSPDPNPHSKSYPSPRSNSGSAYSYSLPSARARRTSTPAYSRSYSSPASSSSTPHSRALLPHRPLSTAYSSQPRRPSPLSGPPLVAPLTPTESSHSAAHEEGPWPAVRPRARSSRVALESRPQSELLIPDSISANPNERTKRVETKRSISVVGDDWTRAYEAVDYDLDLDLRWFKSSKGTAMEPGGDDVDSEDSDAEVAGETDAMLRADLQPMEKAKMAPEGRIQSLGIRESASANSSTRHARTPSAGWRAWSGDYDHVDILCAGVAVTTPAEQQTRLPTLSATPSASVAHILPPFHAPAMSITAAPTPAPAGTLVPSSSHPPNQHSEPSLRRAPSLPSTPSVHSTSSQKGMGTINASATLPPLPSPVKSPLLDRARSQSHDHVDVLVTPPVPSRESPATLWEKVDSRVTPVVHNAQAPSSSSVPRIAEPSGSEPSWSPDGPQISSARAQISTRNTHVSSSGPPESAATSLPSVDRPAPPFLVLSYKPSAVPAAAIPSTAMLPPALPLPVAPSLSVPASVAELEAVGATPTQKSTMIPLGATPQRSSTSSPPNLLPTPLKPPSFLSRLPAPFLPPSTVSPPPPRGSMILYHVSLPSSNGARPDLRHAHSYQSFGNLGAHTNLRNGGLTGVGEDGMLLPPGPSRGSRSPSSSSSNIFFGMNCADVVSPSVPPPVNKYSSHSSSRNSTYSISADSVAAPSYFSVSPLEDRDNKYAVGLMIGTMKSAQSQSRTFPRVGTPLAASFAFRDLNTDAGADAHSVIDVNCSTRGNVLGDNSGGGPIVAYAYDPDEDDSDDDADGCGVRGGDWLHDPDVWPYADGDEDFHAQRGDWKARTGQWWGGTKDRETGKVLWEEVGGGLKDDGVHLEMLGSTSTTFRSSVFKEPLQSHIAPDPSSHVHAHAHARPYLPPYKPPTTLDTLFGRGAASAFSLFILIVGLLALFIVYPITQVYGTEASVATKILGNTAINSTGQAVV